MVTHAEATLALGIERACGAIRPTAYERAIRRGDVVQKVWAAQTGVGGYAAFNDGRGETGARCSHGIQAH